ncbi:MAG: helix-turn-helix transcriptional regulator [Clostridia bacterium]|nr:helix-turn-helix transcriptional regulator [Clostridia bacterium]
MKIGDVEKVAGVSTGYFSRVSKNQYKASLSIESLVKIANLFEVSVDALLFADFESHNPGDAYLLNFICKLTKLTEGGEIDWKSYSSFKEVFKEISEDFSKKTPVRLGAFDSPLTIGVTFWEELTYKSLCYPKYIATPYKNIYITSIDGGGKIALVLSSLSELTTPYASTIDTVYELYLLGKDLKSTTPICCTTLNHSDVSVEEKTRHLDFDVFLPKLYTAVERRIETPDINNRVLDFINKFNEKY